MPAFRLLRRPLPSIPAFPHLLFQDFEWKQNHPPAFLGGGCCGTAIIQRYGEESAPAAPPRTPRALFCRKAMPWLFPLSSTVEHS